MPGTMDDRLRIISAHDLLLMLPQVSMHGPGIDTV